MHDSAVRMHSDLLIVTKDIKDHEDAGLMNMTDVKKHGLGLRATILIIPLYNYPAEVHYNLATVMRRCLNMTGPFIASYIDIHHSVRENQLMIETEFFGRGSLRNKIDIYRKNRRLFSEAEIWDIVANLVVGLAYLHNPLPLPGKRTNSLLHLGLSPDSVMVYNPLEYKITAYGVRQLLLCSAPTALHKAIINTETERVRQYMAPELLQVLRGSMCQVSTKCDIWSLGVIIFEIISSAFCRPTCIEPSPHPGSVQDSVTPLVPTLKIEKKLPKIELDEESEENNNTTDTEMDMVTDQVSSSATSSTSLPQLCSIYKSPLMLLDDLLEKDLDAHYSEELIQLAKACLSIDPSKRPSAIFLCKHKKVREALQRIKAHRIEINTALGRALQANDVATLHLVISGFDRNPVEFILPFLKPRFTSYLQIFVERIIVKNLFVMLPPIAGRPTYLSTDLMTAAECGCEPSIAECIERDFGYVYMGFNGGTALMLASREGNLECAKLLLAEMGIITNTGTTALMYAAQSGYFSMAQLLLCEARKQTDYGETALMYAAQAGFVRIVSLLAPREARLQRKDGTTALMLAAKLGRRKCVAILSHYEAGMRSKSGEIALELALQYRHGNCAELLVDYESQLACSTGLSPLKCAVLSGVIKIIPRLLHFRNKLDSKYFLTMIHLLLSEKNAKNYSNTLQAYNNSLLKKASKEIDQDEITRVFHANYVDAFCWALNLMRLDCAWSVFDLANLSISMYATSDQLWFSAAIPYMKERGINCQLIEALLNYAILRKNHILVWHLTQYMLSNTEQVKIWAWKRHGDRVNFKTALMDCAEQGDDSGILEHLDEIGRVYGNDTALILATRNSHLECVTLLLCEQGITGPDSVTALMIAACQGDVELVKLLLGEASRCDNDGISALMLAAEAGSEECVQLLIGRCTSRQDHTGRTALIRAAEACKLNVILALQAELGLGGMTELMFNAILNNADAIKEHIEQLGAQTCCGWTALMFAAKAGHVKCIEMLLKETGKRNSEGYIAMMLAAEQGHTECVRLLFSAEGSRIGPNGWTSLMMAADQGHAECVQAIIDLSLSSAANSNHITDEDKDVLSTSKVCVGVQACDGRTALMLAATQGHIKCVQLLIAKEKGLTDVLGECALFKAVRWGNVDCVKLLGPHERDIRAKNGQTALDLVKSILVRNETDSAAQECMKLLSEDLLIENQ